MSLNIVAVVPLPPWHTGAAVMCAELLTALAARGHRIRALAPLTPESKPTAAAALAGRRELRLSRFPVPFFAPFDDASSDEYRRWEGACIEAWLDECIAAERPDVVLVGRGAYGLHVPAVARDAGIPCVVIVHGGPATRGRQGSTDPSWSRIVGVLSDVDLVVTPAQHWAAALRGLGLARVTVIPNPVDRERFAPRPPDETLARSLGLPAERVVVLHASNLQDVKRPMDLVASAERALTLDARLVYVVVGEGPNLTRMVDACRAHGLVDRFRFVGWVDHDRMPAFLSLADIVLMMSEQETQALVYLEAQASGRVLLASDVPGAREVVEDGATGALFRVGDIAHLTDRIIEIAAQPAWRAEIGRKAREGVAPHALPVIAARYERTLEDMSNVASMARNRIRDGEDPK